MIKNVIIVLLLVLVVWLAWWRPKYAEPTQAYGQCGGAGNSYNGKCSAGFKCTYLNGFYSQCLPEVNEAYSSQQHNGEEKIQPYGQCGGKVTQRHQQNEHLFATGGSKCSVGYSCTFFNEWYSQCLPNPSSNS